MFTYPVEGKFYFALKVSVGCPGITIPNVDCPNFPCHLRRTRFCFLYKILHVVKKGKILDSCAEKITYRIRH